MKKIVFLFLSALLWGFSCQSKQEVEVTSLKGTTWKLVGFVDTETGNLKVAEPDDPRCYILTFDTNSTFSGTSSTNDIYGT